MVARHERVVARGTQSLVGDHYLEVLHRKPGVLAQPRPRWPRLVIRAFTATHEAFWRAAAASWEGGPGTRALIEVLLAHRRGHRGHAQHGHPGSGPAVTSQAASGLLQPTASGTARASDDHHAVHQRTTSRDSDCPGLTDHHPYAGRQRARATGSTPTTSARPTSQPHHDPGNHHGDPVHMVTDQDRPAAGQHSGSGRPMALESPRS